MSNFQWSQLIGACFPCVKSRKFTEDRQPLLIANHFSAHAMPNRPPPPPSPSPPPPSPSPPPPPQPELTDRRSSQYGQDCESISFNASTSFSGVFGQVGNPSKIVAVWNETFRCSLVYLKASDAIILDETNLGSMSGWRYTTAVYALCILIKTRLPDVKEMDEDERNHLKLLEKIIDICHQGILEAEKREHEGFNEEDYMDSLRTFNKLTYKAVLLEGKQVEAVWDNHFVGRGILRFRGWCNFMIGEQVLGIKDGSSFIEEQVAAQVYKISPVQEDHALLEMIRKN